MTIDHEVDSGVALLKLSGDFGNEQAPAFRRRCNLLLRSVVSRIVVDLSRVPSMDIFSLSALVGIYTRLRKQPGGDLCLVGVNPDIQALLDMTRLARVVTTYFQERDAIEAMKTNYPTTGEGAHVGA